jgi:hypothetical protein
VLINTITGDYVFCCGNAVQLAGRGTIVQQGCVFTLTHNTGDRRVMARFDLAVKKGNASLQAPPGTTVCTITDTNMANNTCNCAAPPPPNGGGKE